MFGWIKTSYQDVRIFLNYSKYEKKCRSEHIALANSHYATLSLEKKINNIEERINRRANSQFDDRIIWLNNKIRSYANAIEKNKYFLQLFKRNYREELQVCYERKKEFIDDKNILIHDIKAQHLSLRSLYEEKSDAHKQLEDACSDVESWYDKADRTTWFGGNKGRKIPNHSFFGQSFGDLDSAKDDRDKAWNNVTRFKKDIERIKKQINLIKSKIEHIDSQITDVYNTASLIKKNRDEMFLLEKEGLTKKKLQGEITDDSKQKNRYDDELKKNRATKNNFIFEEKMKSGVIEMKVDVELILKEKDAFIAEFDRKENKLSRKKNHRDLWFNKRK